jgi:hypothetical protein
MTRYSLNDGGSSGNAVVLHGGRGGAIPADRVVFAFASGRFAYDCVGCDAQCCRGHGFDLHGTAELARHLKATPSLVFFLRPVVEKGEVFRVGNCQPACFYLSDDGQCEIQRRHGYAAKPETCRLFPFNNIRIVGDHLLVAPHLSLCPLRVVPIPGASEQSSHSALSHEMCRAGIGTPEECAAPVRGSIADLLDLEKSMTDVSEQYLGGKNYLAFAAAQLSATRMRLGLDHGDRLDPAEEISHFVRVAAAVLGVDPRIVDCVDPTVLSTFVAATPALRCQMVFPEKTMPRELRVDPANVPKFLCTLLMFVVLAHQAGMRQVTFQTITRIWRDQYPVLTLLSYADTCVQWRRDAAITTPPQIAAAHIPWFVTIVKSVLAQKLGRKEVVLADILCHALGLESMERLTCLRSVAQNVLAGVVPLRSAAPYTSSGRIYRPTLQRLIWKHSTNRVLEQAVELRHRSTVS